MTLPQPSKSKSAQQSIGPLPSGAKSMGANQSAGTKPVAAKSMTAKSVGAKTKVVAQSRTRTAKSHSRNVKSPSAQGAQVASPPSRSKGRSGPIWLTRLLVSWQLWIFLAMGGVTASGALAFMSLVRLPQALECPRVFWPLASASLRVYCAQAAADKKTHRGLLDAIVLVDSLPSDHPLRPMVDRNIRRWSMELMDVAEELFQDGNLDEALETAERIPYERLECSDSECPEDFMKRRSKRWKTTWEKAEGIFSDSEKALINQKWNKAAEIAALLLSVDNRYWRTTKYEEISDQVQEVRGTNSVLAKAKGLADKGDANSVIEAVRLAASISPKSRLYPIAKGALARYGQQLMALAETSLEAKDLSETLNILDNVPKQANLEKEVKDFRTIARAQSRTWSGSVRDIQAAISDIRKITVDRPYYTKAQTLITRWQTDIKDLARLQKAEQLASRGNIPSLVAAISEASLIPQTNPRYDDARAMISNWTATIQTQEDQPIMDRAEQLAQSATAEGYQAAISEANRIGRGRALYDSAQTRSAAWREKLEWLQDQPFLAQARALAASGNLPGAIASAQQVGSGRLLYGEAQDAISGWQGRVDAENSLITARGYAQDGWNPSSLLQAIETADRVPVGSSLRYDANLEIATWSNRLLQIAIDQASVDLYAAIDTARMVPSWTDSYGAAQSRIDSWQALLQPVAAPEPYYEPAVEPYYEPEPFYEAPPEPAYIPTPQQEAEYVPPEPEPEYFEPVDAISEPPPLPDLPLEDGAELP